MTLILQNESPEPGTVLQPWKNIAMHISLLHSYPLQNSLKAPKMPTERPTLNGIASHGVVV